MLGETCAWITFLFFGAHQAAQLKFFVEELCKTNVLDGVSYTYWDENYTTRV
jgi:hypothetical protein